MTESIASSAAGPPRSRRLQLWLIIGSVVAVLAIVPATFMGALSVMASDAGVNAVIWIFIWTMLTLPLAIILGPLGGWIAYGLRRERVAWILLFAPFAWVAVLIVILSLGFGTPDPI